MTFSALSRLLTDGGGQLVNDIWRLIVDRFCISLEATSAQAPWNNGACQRHIGTIKLAYSRLLTEEPSSSPQRLLDMVCFAKTPSWSTARRHPSRKYVARRFPQA